MTKKSNLSSGGIGTGYRGSTGTKKASGKLVNARKEGYASGVHKSTILNTLLGELDANYFTQENIENLEILSQKQKDVYEQNYKTDCSLECWALICYILSSKRWRTVSGCTTDADIDACSDPGEGTCLRPRSKENGADDYKYGHAVVWLKYFRNQLEKPVEIIETYNKLTGENPFDIMKEDAESKTETPQVIQMMAQPSTVPSSDKVIIIPNYKKVTKKEIQDEMIPRGKDVTTYVKNGNYRLMDIAWGSEKPLNLLIAGHKGTGKTQLVRTFAYDNSIPCVTLDCSNETGEEQLKGGLINLGTYQLGVIPRAFEVANKYGECILHLDEMSCLLKTEQKLLNSLLDWRTEISIPETGKVYRLLPNAKLMVIGTMNPLTARNDYEVEKLNPDLKSRFLQVIIPYPKEHELEKIVKANIDKAFIKIVSVKTEQAMEEDDDSVEFSIFSMLIKTAIESQQKDVGYAFSPRDLVNALRFMKVTFQYNLDNKMKEAEALDDALKEVCKQLVAKADPDEQRALADVVNGNFGHIIGEVEGENE